MKKIIIIVLVFVVVVLGAYFSTGLITERTLRKNLSTLNQANGLSVVIKDYHRGLFQSTADLTWQMAVPKKVVQEADGRSLVVPPKPYTFDMPLVVYHGPIVFDGRHIRFGLGAAHGQLTLPESYTNEFSNIFTEQSTQPELTVKLFVTYLIKTYLEAEVPAFHLVTKQKNSQLEWLGMNSDFRFSPEKTRLQGHLILDGLRLTNEKIRVVLNKLASDYNVHKAENGLFLGEANLSLPVLQVNHKNQENFALKALDLNTKSTLQKDLFASSFEVGFKQLRSDNKDYGPGSLAVSVKNLNAPVLAEINQSLNELHQADTVGNEAQKVLFSLLPNLPKLLEKGAVFEVSTLKLRMPEGDIDGAVKLVFPVLTTEGPMQILPKVEGEGHLKMPAAFLKTVLVHSFRQQLLRAHDEKQLSSGAPADSNAEVNALDKQDTAKALTLAELKQQAVQHADQKLADLIQVGTLQAKGADYTVELKLSSGRLLVNGHPFHSGMLSF